ncbi:NapC/NirT cytochrome c family protein [Geothermobacter ehrlichii]|uniref:NapC/NirT cytochrome c family protein n=1 Tax=Geothermobacter ehrlichii TaxID=213224 RepID=A0A5D3WFW7_9BACT|nr:NapC/NirT family cytochrome c [Geothermobacter ehrlichii]TYO95836.1 NapC/NirT cytochrome c family protein [Geothermobacter ehrlichii]
MASLKNFFAWCKRHYLLVTFLGVLFIVVFGFVNIQILHMTSEPEFCHMCHPAQGFGPLAEVDSWEHSAHGEAGVSCLDCHGRPGVVGYIKAKLGGLKDTYMQLTISKEEKLKILQNPKEDLVPDQQCLFCHSDEGNQSYRKKVRLMKIVRMRLLDDVKNPEFRMHKGLPDILTDTFVGGTHFDHAMHREAFDFKCRDCHFGLVHNPSTKTDRMNMCVACHKENEDSEAPQVAECQRCHEAQYDMNKGIGAKDVAGEPGLMWGNGIGCQDCHTGVAKGVYRPTSETCSNCHDESYKEIFNDWASETKAEIADLRELRITVEDALKDADKKKRDTKAHWERYEKALYNFRLVRNDGTNGVHNHDYAQAILASVKKDFNAILNALEQSW